MALTQVQADVDHLNDEELETATIVTTNANRTLAPIHDRMPVILASEAFDLWLDSTKVDATAASALIMPAPESLLEAYEVSTDVNRTANDNPKVIEPIAVEPAPSQPAAKPPEPRAKRVKKSDGQSSLF